MLWVSKYANNLHLFCLFDLILYVTSTIFQLNRDGSSWAEPVLMWDKCVLLKDHNAVTPVRLEPAAPRFQVKHSTTEPLRSLNLHLYLRLYSLYHKKVSENDQEKRQSQTTDQPMTPGERDIVEREVALIMHIWIHASNLAEMFISMSSLNFSRKPLKLVNFQDGSAKIQDDRHNKRKIDRHNKRKIMK